jgi:Mn-dependent DtxR family transcriptional regulator
MTSLTANAALHVAQPNQNMYEIVYDAVFKSPNGLTTDEIAAQLNFPNHMVSSRVAYLTCYGYLTYTPERRETRNGYDAEVLLCTNKSTANGFLCPIRETQKDFLLRITELIETQKSEEALDAISTRYNSLRR